MGLVAYKAKAIALANKIAETRYRNIRACSLRARSRRPIATVSTKVMQNLNGHLNVLASSCTTRRCFRSISKMIAVWTFSRQVWERLQSVGLVSEVVTETLRAEACATGIIRGADSLRQTSRGGGQ